MLHLPFKINSIIRFLGRHALLRHLCSSGQGARAENRLMLQFCPSLLKTERISLFQVTDLFYTKNEELALLRKGKKCRHQIIQFMRSILSISWWLTPKIRRTEFLSKNIAYVRYISADVDVFDKNCHYFKPNFI